MANSVKAALASFGLALMLGCSQHEAPPCGPASLVALGKAWGLPADDQRTLTIAAERSPRMTSFAQLSATAASVHLQAKGYRLTPSELFRNHTRGIMELNNGHFVALVGFRDDLAVIADPRYIGDDRAEEWSRARLENQWTRRILVISKPERKKPG